MPAPLAVSAVLRRQWFLLSLLAVLVAGMGWPAWFTPLNWAPLRKGIVASAMFLMAFPLEASAVGMTLRRPWAALLGSLLNLGILPAAAWLGMSVTPEEYATGLLVAASVPCTLASAAVWTRRAGGNDATALLVTIVTNISCTMVTPMWLLLATRTRLTLPVANMMADLAWLILLPMVIAQGLRLQPTLAQAATRHKATCAWLAQIGILVMVLIGASQCGTTLASAQTTGLGHPGRLAWMLIVVCVLHVSILQLGKTLAHIMGFARGEQIAVAIAGSQKTLMVGLQIAIDYFGGFAVLPMVAYHIGQLVLDTLFADAWRQADSTDDSTS